MAKEEEKNISDAITGRNESRLREQGSYIKKGLTKTKSCADHIDNVAFHALLLEALAEDQRDQQRLQHGRD